MCNGWLPSLYQVFTLLHMPTSYDGHSCIGYGREEVHLRLAPVTLNRRILLLNSSILAGIKLYRHGICATACGSSV